MDNEQRLNTSVWDGDETGWTTVVSKRQRRLLAKKRARKLIDNEVREVVPGWSG